MMLRSRVVGASVRNGMDGPVVGAALTNAEFPSVGPAVVDAPSLPHALQHRESKVNVSTA